MLLRSIIFSIILFLIDLYVFQAVRVAFRGTTFLQPRSIYAIYWVFCIIPYMVLITSGIIDWHLWPKALRTYLFAFVFISFFAKLFVMVFLLLDDIIRLFRWVFSFFMQKQENIAANTNGNGISRSDFLVRMGLIIGAIPFFSLLYGMVNGAYNYSVKRVKLKVPHLPDGFNGFKIVQLSDIHTGSFTLSDPVHKSVSLAMDEKPDIIFFTGDLVNDRSDEALPFIEIFNKLKAPHGVYSIFGNHDYGDYIEWESPEAKKNNLEKLKQVHEQLGWRLLLDEHVKIQRGSEHIGLLGVQNWSTQLRFPKYGSMEKATQNFEPAPFNILLSLDPSHWRAEILKKYPFVDLMLAGHTHGFQFGVEIPGFKWNCSICIQWWAEFV